MLEGEEVREGVEVVFQSVFEACAEGGLFRAGEVHLEGGVVGESRWEDEVWLEGTKEIV